MLAKTDQPGKSLLPSCEEHHNMNEIEAKESSITILDTTKAQRMAEFFGMLADPNRLRILSVLTSQRLCVCDIATTLNMSESAVSHQLRLLRSMKVVKWTKVGRRVYYSLEDHHILELYNSVSEHINEESN
ncbi:MAG: ArsR family transcriptional regulator [Cyanobacteria bacterium J083]|nr:MAG: ArsR family transcriptional regulator [Cyanobacteria bacterium J083]